MVVLLKSLDKAILVKVTEIEMKILQRSPLVTWLTTFSLLLSLTASMLLGAPRAVHAGNYNHGNRDRAHRMASDLRQRSKKRKNEVVKVIVQIEGAMSDELRQFLRGNGVRVKKEFRNFNTQAIELPASALDELSNFSEVRYLSTDSEIMLLGGHLATTTGTDHVRQQVNSLGQSYTLDGSGIGIAVLDSGIDTNHISFTNAAGDRLRVVFSKDFTGENRTDDPFGHGTHVASIAAGNGRISNGKYIGIAPNANLVNLRVLNSQGTGSVSSVMSALEWILTNRATYNIRVVNMSLGMPAIDSYRDDPLCMAVRRLVNAGVMVVAAAGNSGQNSEGTKIYGQIHSPGNEPSVLTVGAANTSGTNYRSDDSIASYSSRGPTRSFWTDANGIKHYDNLIKPEIAAPGNKIISAQSFDNKLVRQNPSLDANISNLPRRKMMKMNGTSMATPVAAGAAALLLQANPKLTPNMIKAILMYTAQPLAGFNMLEQGAGEINIEGALRLAKLVRTDLTATTTVGSPMLTAALPSPFTTIGSYRFAWSQGIILDHTYATGSSLMTKYQGIYGSGVLLGNGTMMSDTRLICDINLMSSGVVLSEHILTSHGITISEGDIFLGTGTLLSDGVMISDGVMLSDGVVVSDGVMISDSVMLSNSIMQAYSAAVNGDATTLLEVEVDTGLDYLGF